MARRSLYDSFPNGGFHVIQTGNRPRNPGLKLPRRKRPTTRKTSVVREARHRDRVLGTDCLQNALADWREGVILALLYGTVIDPATRKPIRLVSDDVAALMSGFKVSGRTVRRIRGKHRACIEDPQATPAT